MTKIDYEAARSGKRKVTTRCGYPVRLVSNEGAEPFVLVGYVTEIDGRERRSPHAWLADGSYWEIAQSEFDLIQEPEVIECKRWVNVYEGGFAGSTYEMEAQAQEAKQIDCIATVPLTIRIVGDKVEIFGGTEERKDDE